MIYVLEVYSYQSNKIYQMMYSENSIKLQKFIDLAIEYHINWNYCEQTFREFCTGRCSNDWLDGFGNLLLPLPHTHFLHSHVPLWLTLLPQQLHLLLA